MKLSIITINFNSAKHTSANIASIKQCLQGCNYIYEIIVVDNASESEDYQQLVDIEGINLIRNSENSGFAGANNIGFKAAQGDYIMILNNDATIRSDIFAPMMDFMEQSPQIGAISPKIVYDREPYIIQYGGYRQGDRYLFDIQSTQHGKRIDEVEDQAQTTSFAHGAAMMLSREALNKAGAMREDYFLYFEEIDFSLQLTRAGFQIWYFPASVVYHDASASVSKISNMKIYYNSRNRFYLASNNLKGWTKFIAIMIQLYFSFPKSVIKLMIKGRFSEAAAYTRGVWDFIRGKRGKK